MKKVSLFVIILLTAILCFSCKSSNPVVETLGTTSEEISSSTRVGNFFTAAPKNPITPEEVTAAFYFYALGEERDIKKAMDLVEKDKPDHYHSRLEVETLLKSWSFTIYSVKITSSEIYAEDDIHIRLETNIDGRIRDADIYLLKENNRWKVRLFQFF